jgi:hypothetical protein
MLIELAQNGRVEAGPIVGQQAIPAYWLTVSL